MPNAMTSGEPFQLFFFTDLRSLPICAGKVDHKLGRVTDLVFKIAEPYPEAVGIYVEHSGGRPNEFIPWTKVVKIEDDAIFITPNDHDQPCGRFVDQPGWLMLGDHFVGRTIFDMDGRRTEVVNDVHLLYSKGRMLLVHVDVSFNGFLRRWHLRWLMRGKDQLISWRYVQPLSIEDVGKSDAVTLSVTRKQIQDLPGEDLADALELLSGREQTAVFSALGSEKAAEVLVEAEPRAQRQLIANLRREKAGAILSEMSVPQLTDLLSVLPHDQQMQLLQLLPAEDAGRVRQLLSNRETTAQGLISDEFITVPREQRVGDIIAALRSSKRKHDVISYVYVVGPENLLLGVVDLRELILAEDAAVIGDLMISPVVSAQQEDQREDLAELFGKYHYRMLPVVDAKDHLLGVIHYNDIMRGTVTRTRS